jgi:hypothetical protein
LFRNCSKKTHLTAAPRQGSTTALRRAASATVLSTVPLSIAPPLHRPTSPLRPSAAASLPPSPLHLAPVAAISSARTRRGLLHQTCRSLLYRSVELYTGELHALTTSIYKQQGNVALKEHVASLYFKCFRCFIGMFQVFHMMLQK